MEKILVLIVSCVIGSVSGNCDVPCDEDRVGYLVEDPHDCTQYYYCLVGGIPSATAIPCDPGYIFSPENGACVEGQTCTSTCPIPYCELYCPGQFGNYINDPFNCQQYYACTPDGQQVPGECPEGKFFDVTLQICTDDKYACCRCEAACYEPNTEVANPSNCSEYYICDGDLKLLGPFSCPEGSVYDEYQQICSEDATCIEPCKEGGGTTDNY